MSTEADQIREALRKSKQTGETVPIYGDDGEVVASVSVPRKQIDILDDGARGWIRVGVACAAQLVCSYCGMDESDDLGDPRKVHGPNKAGNYVHRLDGIGEVLCDASAIWSYLKESQT